MSKKILLADAKCKKFSVTAPIEVLDGEDLGKDDKALGDFKMTAYTGQPVQRWWGMLILALDGMKARAKMPIFRDHNSSKIVGWSKKTWKDGAFFVAGVFASVTEHAKEVKALAKAGFPWQASVGIRPVEIVSLKRKEVMEVNGKTIKGPAEVWTKSEVFETSFVPLGADNKTKVAVFSAFDELEAPEPDQLDGAEHTNQNKSEKEADMLTLEQLKKDAPDLLAQIQETAKKEGLEIGIAQGAKQELNRIQSVNEQMMSGHEDLVTQLMFDGKTTGEQAAVQILKKEKEIRVTTADQLAGDGIKPAKHVQTQEVGSAKTSSDDLGLSEEQFKANKELSSDFGGDYEAYQAYCDAMENKQVRYQGK